jgi:hypothetical protein
MFPGHINAGWLMMGMTVLFAGALAKRWAAPVAMYTWRSPSTSANCTRGWRHTLHLRNDGYCAVVIILAKSKVQNEPRADR